MNHLTTSKQQPKSCVIGLGTQTGKLLTQRQRGFTLVELLVVIAIIAMLVGLLLPAVQAAREAARRTQCANNLKQMSLACLNHESQLCFLPSGGWGNRWVGDSSRGFGAEQPGSWLFSILPFIEEADLHAIGGNLSADQKEEAITQQNQIVVSFLNCPSRRQPVTLPTTVDPFNAKPLRTIIRSDFAACAGDSGNATMPNISGPAPAQINTYDWQAAMRGQTGVCFVRSEIAPGKISDGMSRTLLVGEKNLDPQHYATGQALNDNQGAYTGFNWDNQRVVSRNWPPTADTADSARRFYASFGSVHPGIWQAAYCDGHVSSLDYTMDLQVVIRMANRKDEGQ